MPRLFPSCARLLAVGALLAAEASARADEPPPADPAPPEHAAEPPTAAAPPDHTEEPGGRWDPVAQRNAASAELGWNSSKRWGSSFSLVPELHYEVLQQIFLDAYLPIAWTFGNTRGGIGNPTIGAHYASTAGKLTWFVGARISLPLASFHSAGYQVADEMAMWTHGGYDAFLWAPEYFPISATLGVEYRAADFLYVRASVDPFLLISTTGTDYVTSDSDPALAAGHASIFGFQARLEGEARTAKGFGGGLGLQGVFQLTSSDGDAALLNDNRAQLALNPFVAYDDRPYFGRFGLLLALDAPLGFGFGQSDSGPGRTSALLLQVGKHLQ